MSSPPTLRDVARAAGVHPATASRALSGNRPVKPEIARQVQRAAAKLGYRVNHIGRALRQQSTGTVGMVVPDIDNPFFPSLVQAVERTLHTHDAGLFLCDASDDPEVEAERVHALLQRRVDGIIISPVHQTESIQVVKEAAESVPVVQVDRVVDVPTDVVAVDQGQLVRLVLDHLESEGRRRFALVASDPTMSTVAERLAMYRSRFADSPDDINRMYIGKLSLQWGAEAAKEILAKKPLPDAVICANDLIALGAIQQFRRAGLAVPGDIAVTGVDDTPFSQVVDPPLTTVRQPLDQMAEEAVDLLYARRDDPSRSPRRLILSADLIVRASSRTP